MQTDIVHGREWDYTVNKCHCDECKAAHAESQRAYRKRRKARGWRLSRGKWVRVNAESASELYVSEAYAY